jgi:glutamate/tyrosine decarboxylase-like PLP-dependent enzyme
MNRSDDVDLNSLFLGPKGENADVLERLLLEALRDHVFWRRNFHPEDGFVIREQDKRAPAYDASVATLWQELYGLLAELKNGVPFFSPRYVGHMTSDLTMASLVGYFAAMLYNPNNVASEGSPVTTRLELEVAAQLAAMIGYDPARQWGHLCSGGTVANIEALWVARNVRYVPVALRWAAGALGVRDLAVRLPGGGTAALDDLALWELLNLTPEAALDAVDDLLARHGDAHAAWETVRGHSLSGLGFQEFGLRLAREFGDALPPGVVLAPSTAHYSWAKACRVLGLGESQLVHVPVDDHFRMDPAALAETLRTLAARRQPVIACVSVIGATEESAVDRLDLLADVRDRAAAEEGIACFLHADAAWGGYAASITRDGDGGRRTFDEVREDHAPLRWPSEGLYRALCALERTDSTTIDPHKLGFVPYPAGAVSFRDRRVKALVATEAPYLFHRGASEWGGIGQYILEGSKPGAAAAAVWMSHKVLPLDRRGYGRLVGATMRGALHLYEQLAGGTWAPFRLVLLPEPDLNIVCFAVTHASLGTLERVNAFAHRVYEAMSVNERRPARTLDHLITKTVLRAEEYGDAVHGPIEALGFTVADYRRAGGLAVLRCTVMDPFFAGDRDGSATAAGFTQTLRRVLDAELRAGD